MTTPDQDAALCEHAARFCDAQLGFSTGRHLRALAVKLRGMGEHEAQCVALLRAWNTAWNHGHGQDCTSPCYDVDNLTRKFLAAHPAPADGEKEQRHD